MQTLYKVLIAFCVLFFIAGVIYVLYYLPKVPAASSAISQSAGGSYVNIAEERQE